MNQILVFVAVLLAFSASPQHQHPASGGAPAQSESLAAEHHACLEQERQAIERGEGFGMAMAADHNGYPGPRHVLDLKAELKLTAEQEAAINALFTDMKQKALALGREILAAEQHLDESFAKNRPENELRDQVNRIGELRAELRWVHLRTHLAARKLMTVEQVELYRRKRYPAPR